MPSNPTDRRSLNRQDSFPCPICRNGSLQAMVMMDDLSCSFCRHIFSADLNRQILRVEDTLPKSAWIWMGDRWTSEIARNADMTNLVWFTAIFLLIIPTLMIAIPGYVFPPIGGLKWNSFSVLWTAFTLGIHSLIGLWLLIEHYQFPGYIAAKITIQRKIQDIRESISNSKFRERKSCPLFTSPTSD